MADKYYGYLISKEVDNDAFAKAMKILESIEGVVEKEREIDFLGDYADLYYENSEGKRALLSIDALGGCVSLDSYFDLDKYFGEYKTKSVKPVFYRPNRL